MVFEKHPGPDHVRDWNMGLHWGAEALEKLLPPELWNELQSVQVDPHVPTADDTTLTMLNARTGEKLFQRDTGKFYRLQRSKLRALLGRGLDVRYGKELVNVEFSKDGHTAKALFADGGSFQGRLIVGADGANSMVRKLVVGVDAAQNRSLPYSATWGQSCFPAEKARMLRGFHPLYIAGLHPDNYFAFHGLQDIPDPEKPETWKFFFYISWMSSIEEQEATADWDNARRLRQVKSIAERFTDPWKTAFASLPDDHQVWHMNFRDWDPAQAERWDNHQGRVTLAGDAAHTMTYQRGQGLNHSLTDAANLVKAAQSFMTSPASSVQQQQDVIAAYEKEIIARAGEEVRVSTLNTEMQHDWKRIQESPFFKAGLKNEVRAN